MTSYDYIIAGSVNLLQLRTEINNNVTITTFCNYVNRRNNNVTIFFITSLSSPEKTELDSLISEYVFFEYPFVELTATGSNDTTTVLQSTQTSNRIILLPDADTTLLGANISQTITNSTMSDSSNNVGANELRTIGNSVIIDQSSPPISGQILKAISATGATWQNSGDFFANGSVPMTGTLDMNGNDIDNCTRIQLGTGSSLNQSKCVEILFTANSNFSAGLLLKIVDSGGVAKVEPTTSADPAGVAIVGVSTTTGTTDSDISVCICGIFDIVVQSGVTISIGDNLEKTTSATEPGRITTDALGVGTVAVALTPGTGDVGGTVVIRGIWKKNEVF